MKINAKPKSRKTNLVVQNLDNETLVYDLRTSQAFCLNKTSGLIWQYCDGKNSVADIRNLVSHELQTIVSEAFVILAVNGLYLNNLVEPEAEFEGCSVNLNRRDIIKKVGLTSMVALPMIIAVVAPNATNAASVCLGGNQPISCEVTVPRIGNGECVTFTVIAPNAWLCSQPACCSGNCINVDPAVNGTNGVCNT